MNDKATLDVLKAILKEIREINRNTDGIGLLLEEIQELNKKMDRILPKK